jgi:hypothetical protein
MKRIGLLVLLLLAVRVHADEPLFGYVYTTDLLPSGRFEVAQWATWRAQKPIGTSEALEGRTELEYGLTDNLQVAAYFNYEWANAYHNNVINGTTQAPTALAFLKVGADDHLNTTRYTGVSLEAIYRILSPYTDPVGVALYFRPTIGSSLRELESRIIVQKNYRDDRLVLAVNIGLIDDRQYLPTVGPQARNDIYAHPWTETSTLNLGAAASYRFVQNLSVGTELQNERGFSAITPFGAGSRTGVAYYFGPSLHYADQHMFVTATYLTQLPFASDYAHGDPDYVVGARLYSGSAERYRVRLKFGWYF